MSSPLFRSLLVFAIVASCANDALVADPQDGSVGVTDAGADVVDPDAPTAPDARDGAPFSLAISGRFARKALRLGDGAWAVLTERPKSIADPTALDPDRALAWVDADGVVQEVAVAPAGRALLDVALHPSGELTMLFAASEGFFLERYGLDRKQRASFQLIDPSIATDAPAMGPGESRSPIEEDTHDVGRIDADDEGVVMATRTGRHSVIAYRVGFDRFRAAYEVQARTLVVPAHSITPVALNGGTYDTFGQLDAHYAVHVARGTSGIAWIAVGHARLENGALVKAHQAVFGETLVTDPDWLDVYVTRVSKQGLRLGTSVVSTPNDDQLFGLRVIGDDAFAVGRTEHWNEQGTGFDALVGKIDAQGEVTLHELAIDRGDIAFDVAAAPDAGVLVVGASGYSQNPHGASISEESNAFARWFRSDGTVTAIDVPNGPRHNEARFILPLGAAGEAATYAVGGMHDGPGTHSADGNLPLLRANGFIATTALP